MKERLRSLQKYIEVYRCVGIDKVLKTIPCRFAYSVANEHVDEKKFHEKVLYRMRHNKYDSLRKSSFSSMESAIRSAFVGSGVNGIPVIININIIGC